MPFTYKWKYWEIDENIEFLNHRNNTPDLVDDYGHSIQSEYYCSDYKGTDTYVYDVLVGNRIAGQTEIAACERYVYDRTKRPDLDFDKDEIKLALAIVANLRHPKGPIKGKPFYPIRYLQFVIVNAVGWYYNENARESLIGDRRFDKVTMFIARGGAKTVLSSALSIYQILTTRNGSPAITCSAPTQKQSRLAFTDISTMIRTASLVIKKKFKVLQNEVRCLVNDGRIFPTSKQANNLEGTRITSSVLDEIHIHADSTIVDAVQAGMSSSSDPQIYMISTAGTNLMGFGKEVFDYTKEIIKNQAENDRSFGVIYEIDEGDDISDENNWHKANPGIGYAVRLEGLRSAYQESKRSSAADANFRTKHCNQWVTFNEDSLLDFNELMKCQDKSLDLNDYKGRKVHLGLDLASVSDLSSLTMLFPEDDGSVAIFSRNFLPETALIDLKQSIKEKYFSYQKSGELVFTPSVVTDLEYITQDILRVYQDYDVQSFGIDAAAGGVVYADTLEQEHGIECVSVKQGFGLCEPAVLMQNLVKDQKIKFSEDILLWTFGNALQYETNAGDIKVIRDKNDLTKKIDPLISALCALSLTILVESTTSHYEHNTLRVI